MKMKTYQKQIRALLSPAERRIVSKLSTPKKIQDFLESFPTASLGKGEHSMRSPREVLKVKKAHCMEGALLAATALAYQGHSPLLMDFQTTNDDEDHVIALFKQNGYWGALSKTNHPVLRYRDAIYKNVRELAMSYFHEYYMWGRHKRGQKTMRAYSKPFDLSKYPPEKWVTARGELDWLAEALDDSPHYPALPKNMVKHLRNATEIEIKAMQLVEWKKMK